MNDQIGMNDNVTQPRPLFEQRPSLSFYHANAKGTGSVAKFELHPAHGKIGGSIFASIAMQKTVGNRNAPQPTFSTFDWDNVVCVKLDVNDLSEMLQVFRGVSESLGDTKGLFHESSSGSAIIRLEHRIDPVAGYAFSISKKFVRSGELRAHVFLRPAEALALMLAIEQSMGVLCFGLPQVIPREAAQYGMREDAGAFRATGTDDAAANG